LEFLFVLIVAGAIIAVLQSQSKVKAGTRSAQPAQPAHPAKQSSGLLGFQETGTAPKTDSAGRVIVKLKGGSQGIVWGVNRSHLDYQLANKLAGKVNDDLEFSKSVKVRIRHDAQSQFANSVIVETTDEKFIGWILKDYSDDAVSVMNQIAGALGQMVPQLANSNFVYEVSAKIEGAWDEIGEDDKEEWEADIELMEIRIKTPAEIEVD
jgi:hypothetical protein